MERPVLSDTFPHAPLNWEAHCVFRHGYLVLDLTPERAQADWYFSKNILEQTVEEEYGEGWYTKTGESRLCKAEKSAGDQPVGPPACERLPSTSPA